MKLPPISFWILTGLFFTSCISVDTKPIAATSKKMLTIEKSEKLSQERLIRDLSRSTLLPGNIYEAIYVEATLQSPSLAYRQLERKAQIEKWTDDRLAAKVEELMAYNRANICFNLLVKSNHELSKDEKNWQVSLLQDGSRQTLASLSFTETSGDARVATTAFSHVRNDMKYFLESELCFGRSHVEIKELVLIVDPKYDEKAEAAALTWQFKK